MAAQAALVAETIIGMKRAISDQQYCKYLWKNYLDKLQLIVTSVASDSDEVYLQPTNRGNKLKRKAQSAGLDGPSSYKRVRNRRAD